MRHCARHAIADSASLPVMDEHYFALRTYTSVLRGRINDQPVVAKVWRGAPMSEPTRQVFVEVSVSHLCLMIIRSYQHSQHLSDSLDNWKRASEHPNISSFVGMMSGLGHLPSLVTPYYPNGNLNTYLQNNPEANILSIVSCFH